MFTNTDLSTATSGTTSVIGEPSVGNNGPYVFETGNWYAALSTDGGSTFGFVNPFTTFPSAYGGFCCDQVVLYNPSRGLLFWMLLYLPNSSGNILRLAIAKGQALASLTFYYYDFKPQDFPGSPPPFPSGDWYDYPYLAFSNNYLYVSVNVFTSAQGFDGTVVLRLPLDALAAGTGFSYNAYLLDKTLYFNATLTQGATDTMYWATQDMSTTATIRIYQWPESRSVTATNISHTPYPATLNYSCPGPDSRDWCGRLDDRVLTGWVSNGIIGFMWNAPQGSGGFGTFAYPYIQSVLINQSTMSLIDQPVMYNNYHAFAYAAAGVNARGHVAGPVFYGGGTAAYPTLAAFIWDDLSPNANPTPPTSWETYTIAASTQGPTENKWGDYLASRLNWTSVFSRFLWIGTGYTLVGGGSNNNVHPRFLSFGRLRDDPATVQANDHPVFFPFISK